MSIDKLLSDNMRLVYKQLHKFNRAYDDDAFSAGYEALYRAAITYKADKGSAFSTYASTCIYNGIACYLRNELYRSKRYGVVSFEDAISEGSDITYADIISDSSTPETDCLNKELYKVLWEKFDKVAAAFSQEAQKQIVYTWKAHDFKITQNELAAMANVSQAYVSRTLSAFKHKLKKEMEEYL